jgi:hypothetical protein
LPFDTTCKSYIFEVPCYNRCHACTTAEIASNLRGIHPSAAMKIICAIQIVLSLHKRSGFCPTKKKQKNSQNSGKIFRRLKIPQIFQIVFLSNILRKNLQKFCQLAAPKKLVRKNF